MSVINMDYLQIQADFITAIRGSRSQRNLTKILRMTPHRIHRLENKKSYLKWSEFIEICAHRQIDLCGIINSTIPMQISSASLNNVLDMLAFTSPSFPSPQTLGSISRFKLYRWQKGISQPKLTDILKLIHLETGRLNDFSIELMRFATTAK